MNNLISLVMNLNDSIVTVEFDWYGEEPDWDDMSVNALLPSVNTPEGKHWVKVNDLISNDDWVKIETEIYLRERELKRQVEDYEY